MNLFEEITPDKAKRIMEEETNIQIVDVRTNLEYQMGHIVGAVNFPNEEITVDSVTNYFPDKEQKLLVYCRSGIRSRDAAQKLVNLGYTNVLEFGGILNWKYETE